MRRLALGPLPAVLTALSALALSSAPSVAAPAASAATLYIEAALVLPVDGDPIPRGRIVVRDGKVAEVGADVKRPPFSLLVDARDQVVTPGFVVAASRIGLPSAESRPGRGDGSTPIELEPAQKGADEHFAPAEVYRFLLQHGVTTLGLLPPGAAPGIQGQASAVSTLARDGESSVLEAGAALVVETSADGVWRAKVGEAIAKAVATADEAEAAEKEKARAAERAKKRGKKSKKDGAPAARPARAGRQKGGGDDKDPVVKAVRKKMPVLLLGGTPADWQAARDTLPLDRMDVVVRDGVELHALASELGQAKVRVLTYPALTQLSRTRVAVNRAAEYEAAGVPYAFLLPYDSPGGAALLRDAAIEMARTGCRADRVLAALTREGALALGQGDAVGSIAKGRRADLLFWSADPLDPVARLERVLVGGRWVELAPEAHGGTP